MTHGGVTYCECICDSSKDRRCGAPLEKDNCREGQWCRWPLLFEEWLRHEFPRVKFTVYDFSWSGVDAKMMSDRFGEKLLELVPGGRLSANDIVLIDHSANDQASSVLRRRIGVELLLRRILSSTEDPRGSTAATTTAAAGAVNDSPNRPTIVMIAAYPHASWGSGRYRQPSYPLAEGDWEITYSQLAQHYGALLFDVRTVFWTYFNTTAATSSVAALRRSTLGDAAGVRRLLSRTINGDMGWDKHNNRRSLTTTPQKTERLFQISPFDYDSMVFLHPPWYVHLFLVDMVAACLLETMQQLVRPNPGHPYYISSISTTQPLVSASAPALARGQALPLPATYFNIDEISSAMCDLTKPLVLDAHTAATFKPPDLTQWEGDPMLVSKYGWREYIDHKDVPGWIINSLSDPSQRILTFQLANSTRYEGMVIKIMHLRSYEGMGKASVYICGYKTNTDVNPLDGLFHEASSNFKASVPDVWVHPINDWCDKKPLAERLLQIEYVVATDHVKERAVHRSKLKILNVEVCTPSK